MMKVANELNHYIIGSNGSDRCHVGFMMREYMTGDNRPWLDGAIIEIMTVLMHSDSLDAQQQELLHVSPLAPQLWLLVHHCVDLNNGSNFVSIGISTI